MQRAKKMLQAFKNPKKLNQKRLEKRILKTLQGNSGFK